MIGQAADEIVVTAIAEGQAIDGKRLWDAQRAFLDNRARFAPDAILVVTVRPRDAAALAGFTLRLRQGERIVPLTVGPDHRAVLPLLDSRDWQLIASRKPSEVGLRLRVFSPGTSESDRRLGDLRLQCRVSWALEKGRFSLPQRAGFDLVGGCASKRIAFWTSAPRPVLAGTIDDAGRSAPLRIKSDGRYLMPVADPALSNEARLHLTFRQP